MFDMVELCACSRGWKYIGRRLNCGPFYIFPLNSGGWSTASVQLKCYRFLN